MGLASLCPRRTTSSRLGAARSTRVHCSWGLAGWVRAKPPGAAEEHEPQAGLRPPPGRAPSSGRVCVIPSWRPASVVLMHGRGVCTRASQGGARCPGLRAPPWPRGPQSKQAPPTGPSLLGAKTAPREWTPAWCQRRAPRLHPGPRAESGPQGYGTAPAPWPPLFGNPMTQHPDLS